MVVYMVPPTIKCLAAMLRGMCRDGLECIPPGCAVPLPSLTLRLKLTAR